MQPNTMKALYPKRELPGSDSNPRFAQTETYCRPTTYERNNTPFRIYMYLQQETQLSLTNRATRLEVSQGHQTWYHSIR